MGAVVGTESTLNDSTALTTRIEAIVSLYHSSDPACRHKLILGGRNQACDSS